MDNTTNVPKVKDIFEVLYLPIWHHHEILSPKFTEFTNSIKEKCNGLQIEFNQKTKVTKPNSLEEFNTKYHKNQNILTLTVIQLSYFYALHELFHFLTTSKKRKIKKNFGYNSNSFINGLTPKEEITDEIKTVFLSSIWFNEYLYTNNEGMLFAALGTMHQYQANNATYLCSILPFGRYKKMINPLSYPQIKDFNEENPSDIAHLIKFVDENQIQKNKTTPTNQYAYRDTTWNDCLINAECSIKAFNELKSRNFIDEEFKLRPIKEWDLQYDFSTPTTVNK